MAEKTFRIITLGCKVNQYESAYLKERFIEEGWDLSLSDDKPDMTIINTCIVTQRASCQSRQAIRKAIRENPSGIIAAIGCYAQVFPDELSDIRGINIVAGNRDKAKLPDLLLKTSESPVPCIVSEGFGGDTPFDFNPIRGFPGRTRAFLKIQDGCESFCSYCIVPFARGPLRSLAPNRVIETLGSLCKNGYREVVLTGVHLGRYGVDLDGVVDLKGLLRWIGDEGFPIRIRLSSLEPNEIDRDMIDLIASEEWICKHVHIPLQSGDDGVLKRMNRHYGSLRFAGLIERIHERMPLAAIGLDTMAGFPGEDDRAFRNTFSLVNDLPISYLHVFPFSPRKGTTAMEYRDRVSDDQIKERARRLRELGKRKREIFYRSCLGKEFSVLTEGWHSEEKNEIKGLSDNYLSVIFQSPLLIKNRILKVRIEEVNKINIVGRPVEDLCEKAGMPRAVHAGTAPK